MVFWIRLSVIIKGVGKLKKIISITIGLSLFGCASEKGYQEYLNKWQGVDTLTLIRDWGAPEQVYSFEGHDFYVYSRESYGKNPRYPYTCPDLQKIDKDDSDFLKDYKKDQNKKTINKCIEDRQTQPREIYYQCKTTFEVFNGKVIHYKFEGNNCVK